MESIQAKRPPDCLHLISVALYGPQRSVIRMVGQAAAKLIIKNNFSFIGKSLEGYEIPMTSSRPTMQDKKLRFIAATHFAVPELVSIASIRV